MYRKNDLKLIFVVVIILVSLSLLILVLIRINETRIFTSTATIPRFAPNLNKDQYFTGFNTQVRLDGSSSLDLNEYYSTIDDIVAMGIPNPTIRFSLNVDDIFPRTDMNTHLISCIDSQNCDPIKLRAYREPIEYAKNAGVKVILVTYVPYFASTYSNVNEVDKGWRKKYSLRDYLVVTSSVHTILAREYGDLVDIWNLFNESNIFAFDSHLPINPLAPRYNTYLKTFNSVLITAATSVKNNVRNAQTTIDIAGLKRDGDSGYLQWIGFIRSNLHSINYLSFNSYPGINERAIERESQALAEVREWVKQPIIITETGLCRATVPNRLDLNNYISATVSSLKKAGASGILLYMHKDDDRSWFNDCEKSFGLFQVSSKIVDSLNNRNIDNNQKLQTYTCVDRLAARFTREGEGVDWNDWSDAARNFITTGNKVTLQPSDWLISAHRYNPNQDSRTTFWINDFINQGDWVAVTYSLEFEGNGRRSFILLKEGERLILLIRVDGEERSYLLDSEIGDLESVGIVLKDNIMYTEVNQKLVGNIIDFSIENIPQNVSYTPSILVESSENSTGSSLNFSGLNLCE